jgi:hypothetical protein
MEDYIKIVLTSPSNEVINAIKNQCNSIMGVSVEEMTQEDIIDSLHHIIMLYNIQKNCDKKRDKSEQVSWYEDKTACTLSSYQPTIQDIDKIIQEVD